MVLIILLILILILFYIINNKFLEIETFDEKKIIFYNKNNLYNILKKDNDKYFQSFYDIDLKVRKINNINDYYKILYNSLCNPDNDIINKITNCIYKINVKLNNYIKKNNYYYDINLIKFINLKWKIGLTCNTEYENGLPHTRDDIIILNKNRINNYNELRIMKTLIHEQVHIYQKKYPDEMNKYLINNRFKKIKKIEMNDNIRANPDLDNFIYQDENYKIYKAVYNENANSIEDVTYYPFNSQSYEHPNEKMAIDFESIIKN
jgi:hypothetical protein